MRRFVFTTVCFLLMGTKVVAQTEAGQSEVCLSLGINTFDQNHSKAVNFFAVSSKRLSEYKIDQLNKRGATGLTYRYYFIDKAAIGLAVVNDKIERHYILTTGKKITGVYNYLALTLAPELNYLYINGSGFSLYSLFGFGFSYCQLDYKDDGKGGLSDGNTYYHINAQVTPIGIRLGDNSIGGYVELGYGYKGIVNLGLSTRF